MKILSTSQIRELDRYTMTNEPIASLDLMERAGTRCYEWIVNHFKDHAAFQIFCGPGNNGGDGLVMARLLSEAGYHVECLFPDFFSKTSPEFDTNWKRLQTTNCIFRKIEITEQVINDPNTIIIDALFGSGLSKPIQGAALSLIKQINQRDNIVISIDIPSGLFCDDNSGNNAQSIINADYTLSIELPKLAFLLPSFGEKAGEWHLIPIGLNAAFIQKTDTNYFLVTQEMVSEIRKKRTTFSHKGTYGHALIVAGSYGKIGAAVLAAKACLRSGAGLVTAHIPACGYEIMQISVPEVMVSVDEGTHLLSGEVLSKHKTVAVGPGIGIKPATVVLLENLFKACSRPMVIDADAINILANHPNLLQHVPAGSIFTPHPKEFERIAGKSDSDQARLKLLTSFSHHHRCYVVLKGAHTVISCPDGALYFNTTGNPGMATAGSGDVLTGIITGLLVQGYGLKEACILGVYLHGAAGDEAANVLGQEAVIAGDLIAYLGDSFQKMK